MSRYNETKYFYKIYDKKLQKYVDAIVGAGTNRTQSEFNSIEEARNFNCHGLFKDKTRYEIHEFKAEISSDCVNVDSMNEQEMKDFEQLNQIMKDIKVHDMLENIALKCSMWR